VGRRDSYYVDAGNEGGTALVLRHDLA